MKKLSLYWHTIRFLKFKQIQYQLLYKIKSKFQKFYKYNSFYQAALYPVTFSATGDLFNSRQKYLGNNSFCFLNLEKQFDGSVDWNFAGHGKLWNYNLQYFDYLNDPAIPTEEKNLLLNNFSSALLSRQVVCEAYPVSLRLINWIIYYSTAGFQLPNFHRAIQFQVDFLRKNLEYHLLANHLLENYLSLFICSYALRDEKFCLQMLNTLESELDEQVLIDGGHCEGSPMYHCIVLSRLLQVLDVIKNNNWITLDYSKLSELASRMVGWLKAFSFRDSSYAHFNDSTNDIAPLPQDIFQAASHLNIQPISCTLSDSGYRKFNNAQLEVITDVANIQPTYQPGHAHSDMFNYCVQYRDQLVVTDAGTSTYENNQRRYFERSTTSHNTVIINSQDQSEVWSSFRVGRRASVAIIEDTQDKLVATHNGYERRYGVSHTRSFAIHNEFLEIIDQLNSDKIPAISYIHFHYSISKPIETNYLFQIGEGINLKIDNSDKMIVEEYQQAIGFNKTRTAYRLKIFFHGALLSKFLFS